MLWSFHLLEASDANWFGQGLVWHRHSLNLEIFIHILFYKQPRILLLSRGCRVIDAWAHTGVFWQYFMVAFVLPYVFFVWILESGIYPRLFSNDFVELLLAYKSLFEWLKKRTLCHAFSLYLFIQVNFGINVQFGWYLRMHFDYLHVDLRVMNFNLNIIGIFIPHIPYLSSFGQFIFCKQWAWYAIQYKKFRQSLSA